jgi:hypothetical protein
MRHVVCALLLIGGIADCKSAGEGARGADGPASATSAGDKSPAAAPAAAPVATAVAAPPSDRVDDPAFELSAAKVGTYAVGQLGTFTVSLKPRGQYHINQDYPIGISVRPSQGLRMAKAELKKPDAAVFGEQLARFDVPLTPEQAGSQRLEAQVRFAVCTPENCVPDERTLALVLAVE